MIMIVKMIVKVKKIYQFLGKDFLNISYCPERVVQGKSISELPKLPQIISGISNTAIIKSKKLFNLICKKTIVTTILEAELIKLYVRLPDPGYDLTLAGSSISNNPSNTTLGL